ncbi:MAG: AmmeMemoRadiSam system protein B [Acidobacteriota bacterium]|nr:AmmeMemoRadiSam system protein B [Acidobacteriota bacterium]
MTDRAGVRAPAVAGLFYPEKPDDLEASVRRHLEAAAWSGTTRPKAVIAPHAGYVYSGPTAGFAFAALATRAEEIERVVLLGPAHRVAPAGLALPGVLSFETPLGRVAVDQELAERIAHLPQLEINDAAHELEHSLEVEIPFLQVVLGEFMLLPLVVGGASPAEVAEVLDLVWGGDETAIVVSSDLSHFLSYDEATRVDRATVEKILRLEGPLRPDQACGAYPINGLLEVAARRHLSAEVVDLRNSGDTAGDHRRVVGYTAVAFH